MSIYVDTLIDHGKGAVPQVPRARFWCHLWSEDIEELHRFAKSIGMKRTWFQVSNSGFPHYDLTRSRRDRALEKGAIEKDLTLTEYRDIRDKFRDP